MNNRKQPGNPRRIDDESSSPLEIPQDIPTDIPAEALPFLREMAYFEADRLQVGDSVPPVTLQDCHGRSVTLGRRDAERPVVLVFGSYT